MGNQETREETYEKKVERKYQYYWEIFDGGLHGPRGSRNPDDITKRNHWKKEHEKLQEEKKLQEKKAKLEKELNIRKLREEVKSLEAQVGN